MIGAADLIDRGPVGCYLVGCLEAFTAGLKGKMKLSTINPAIVRKVSLTPAIRGSLTFT